MRLEGVAFVGYLLGGCAGPTHPSAPPASNPNPVTISIVATNDVHGQIERLEYFSGFLNNVERARGGDVLLVDAGDAIQGTIESNMNEGKAVFSAYDAMRYAALAIGNHEFDFGPVGLDSVPRTPEDDPQGALRARIAEAHFPVLSANLARDDGRPLNWSNLAASTLTEVHGVKIGIIGLLTVDAPDVIKQSVFAGLHVTPLVDAAVREARLLRERAADIVIVVAHAGGECAKFDDPNDLSSCDPNSEIFRFARALPHGMVDVIVGGHRNAGVAHVVAGIPIVHAPSNLLAFSRVDLTFDPATRKVTGRKVQPPHAICTQPDVAKCEPGDYEGAKVVPDPKVTALLSQALATAQGLRQRPVGVTVEAPFPVERHEETAIGNLFADILHEAEPGSDFAFSNAGSIRDTLPAGDLTFGELHHVMPFDNQLARLRLTGTEVKAILARNLSDGEHGLLAVSGITVSTKCVGPALQVVVRRKNGAVVRDDDRLVAVTNDFMALGGDGLVDSAHVPKTAVEIDLEKKELDALIGGLARRKSIRPDDPALKDPSHPRLAPPAACR